MLNFIHFYRYYTSNDVLGVVLLMAFPHNYALCIVNYELYF